MRITQQAAEILHQGVERLCSLLPANMSLCIKLQGIHSRYLDFLRAKKFEDLRRRYCASSHKESKEVARERSRLDLVSICRDSYQVLDQLSEMISATRIIQRNYRAFVKHRADALQRHELAVTKIYG